MRASWAAAFNCRRAAVVLVLCLSSAVRAHRDHPGKIRAGQDGERCDWNNDSEDCDDGLTCWKGFCKDRDPPMIHLSFPKGMAAPKPFKLPPKVELKFPGPGGKTVDCNDVVSECEGPSHPNCVAAKAGGAGGQYWAQNCRKSCGLCAMEEQVEKQFDNWDAQAQQQHQQQPAQTFEQRKSQLEQQLHQLQQQQQQTRQNLRAPAAAQQVQSWPGQGQGQGQQAQAGGGAGGGGSDVLTFSLVAVVVLVAFGYKAHSSATAGAGGAHAVTAGAGDSSSYNPVPGI